MALRGSLLVFRQRHGAPQPVGGIRRRPSWLAVGLGKANRASCLDSIEPNPKRYAAIEPCQRAGLLIGNSVTY